MSDTRYRISRRDLITGAVGAAASASLLASPQTVRVTGLHDAVHIFELAPHQTREIDLDSLENNYGWYDLMVSVAGDPVYARQFAGHIENGRPSRGSAN